MSRFDLTGKKIIIFGGSSGIGRATAIECTKMGAQVAVIGRNKDNLKETLNLCSGNGNKYVVFDLNDTASIEIVFDEILKYWNKVDGMVYSAGVLGVVPIRVLSPERLNKVMKINFFGFVESVRCFVKRRYSQGGSIIGISSAVVERGELCQTAYAASKAAMDAATKCLAIELADKNFRINTVAPGMIATEMMEKAIEGGSNKEELGKNSVLGIGKTEQVADAVIYLLSEASSHTTGRSIYVDGGCFL